MDMDEESDKEEQLEHENKRQKMDQNKSALEKPVSHEAYSTGQCRDFAEPAARQIPSESSLPPDLLRQLFVNLQQMQCDGSKISSNTDPLVELEKIASGKGFVISDNEGSGNCMFYALSEQLNLVKGIKISPGILRQTIVKYLLKNPSLPDGTDLFNFIDRYPSWADYLTNMKQDGTWGDHVILYATANCYKTYICVISSQSNHGDLIIRPDDHVISSSPLVLGHVHEIHYVSLQPKQVGFKEGKPGDCDLDDLAGKICAKWQELGLRLGISQDKLDEIDANEKRKAYRMLLHWRNIAASTTLYRDLYNALSHDGVGLNNVAAEFCGSSVQGRPPLPMEHIQSSFAACSLTPVQTYQTGHTQREEKRTLPPSFQSSPQDPKRAKLTTAKTAEASPVETFDVKTCQRKLAEHYRKKAKVPTTVWSSKFQVDLEQIYTRLSWVRQEQTTSGSSQEKLNHYTEILTEKTKNGVAKRILVQGETGIGKTTFVKKLLLDWANLGKAKMDKERKDALRKFDVVVSINLKEVSKCQTFKEVLCQSRVFPEDDETSVDDLLSYIGENQDKVLLVFDGYDEYRTGSEAEEKYGGRSNSPIYKIFHGNILRDCTVLVTTRSSRADELEECADVHAEITGFTRYDQKDFMKKVLSSQTEVDGLLEFLQISKLRDLARVPLLTLCFCLLWKEEKEKLKEGLKSKTELFQAIVKHILQHSHKRHSPSNASKLKEADYKEILTEIGKVALEGLLRGDLLFNFGQLPEKVRGEESVVVGLLQISEFGPSVDPKEMVSFIHKSIQEYLAAWFVTYSCVPEGNLGGLEEHACTVKDCEALENVFQFVCGLSDKGAKRVIEHFSSVRTRDVSMTLLDADTKTDIQDSKTDVPLYDLTEVHWRFSNLAFNCFGAVKSKTDLLCRFLDCFGEIVPVPDYALSSQCMPNAKDVSTSAHSRTFAFRSHIPECGYLIPPLLLERFIDCFHIPTTTGSTEVHRVCDFLEKFQNKSAIGLCVKACSCHFIFRFHSGQFQFYITDLELYCDDHARLILDTDEISVPSVAANLCSEESCLKFARSLRCGVELSEEIMKSLGAAIKDWKQLRSVVADGGKDSVCDLLEQVPNPSKCSLELGVRQGRELCLTSAGAARLASMLPRFNDISHLDLRFVDAEVDALITSITYKSLKELRLSGMILTPAAVAALGRSLPEMTSLETLELEATWSQGGLQTVDMEALFGRFNKSLLLNQLSLHGFSGSLTPLIKSFRLFPNLHQLYLVGLKMGMLNLFVLLENLRFLPKLVTLYVQDGRLAPADSSTAEVNTDCSFTHKTLKNLILKGMILTPAAAAALGRSLPEMTSLEILELNATWNQGGLQTVDMEALFSRFNKSLPLYDLSLSGFSGNLAPLTKSFRFFPNLGRLFLSNLNMDELNLFDLLESLRFLPKLRSLYVKGKRLVLADSGAEEVSFTHKNLRDLTLKGISLTPTVGEMLGQLLPKMQYLYRLQLIGPGGSVVPAEPMERLHHSGGCLAPITRSFSSLPNLNWLSLKNLNLDEHDLRGLLESFRFIPNLHTLSLSGNPLGSAITSIVPHVTKLPKLRSLHLDGTGPMEDLKSVKQAVGPLVSVYCGELS